MIETLRNTPKYKLILIATIIISISLLFFNLGSNEQTKQPSINQSDTIETLVTSLEKSNVEPEIIANSFSIYKTDEFKF